MRLVDDPPDEPRDEPPGGSPGERPGERAGGRHRRWGGLLAVVATAMALGGIMTGLGALLGVGLVLGGVAGHLFSRDQRD